MRKTLIALIALTLGGCSPDVVETSTQPPADDPAQVAADWLGAVAAGDLAGLERVVEPTGLAVVAAVENNLSSDDLAALLGAGMSADVRREYWEGFAASFAAFQGSPIDSIAVGNRIELQRVNEFAAYALETPNSSGRVVLRRGESGWQIDFAATVGPALIGPLGEYLAAAVSGENASAIAAAYAEAIVPGLDAARELDPENTPLEFETEYIRQLAESVPASP